MGMGVCFVLNLEDFSTLTLLCGHLSFSSPSPQFLSKGSAANEVTLSKTEEQGVAITYPEELEEQLSFHPPASSRHQWFLYLDYKLVTPPHTNFLKQKVQLMSPLFPQVFPSVSHPPVHEERGSARES